MIMKIRWHKKKEYKTNWFGFKMLVYNYKYIEYYNESTNTWDIIPVKKTIIIDGQEKE